MAKLTCNDCIINTNHLLGYKIKVDDNYCSIVAIMTGNIEIVCYRTTLDNINDCYCLLHVLPINNNGNIDDLSRYVGLPTTIDDYGLIVKQTKSLGKIL